MSQGEGGGRPPKPSHLKVLHGDRKDRVNTSEPQPASDVEPSFELSEGAREMWERLAPDMQEKGVLTKWDADAFAELCEATMRLREKRRAADEPAQRGGPNPMRDYQTAFEMFLKLAGRFGMTPSDRSKLEVDRGEESSDDLLSGSG